MKNRKEDMRRRLTSVGYALVSYSFAKQADFAVAPGGLYADPGELLLIDMLADFMHYAAANDIDFDEAIRRARNHFETEASAK